MRMVGLRAVLRHMKIGAWKAPRGREADRASPEGTVLGVECESSSLSGSDLRETQRLRVRTRR